MNVAMFTDSYLPRINGVSISVQSYADELANLGHKILIICCDYKDNDKTSSIMAKKSFLEKTNNPNINIYRVSSIPVILSKEDRFARISQWSNIKEQLKNFIPDVIHINSEFSIGASGLIYGSLKKIPIIFTFHTLWEEYASNYMKIVPEPIARKLGRDLVKHYLKHADEIIVPTERIAEVVNRYGIDRPVDILPTGIPKSIYTVDEKRLPHFIEDMYTRYPCLKNSQVLLYVGRVAKEKNLEFLIKSFEQIQQTKPDTVLMIVGGGPDLENLEEAASQSPYKDKIIFTGYCDREDLPLFYHTAKVFVFPSVTETQGLVTIEAMMSGTPVVAIGEMGTADVMQGDNGGFMVKNDINEFSEKILCLLNDKDLYEKKVQEAMEWSKKWSIQYLTPKLISYYEKGIEKRKSGLSADSRT